jgi:hypothetical protein
MPPQQKGEHCPVLVMCATILVSLYLVQEVMNAMKRKVYN